MNRKAWELWRSLKRTSTLCLITVALTAQINAAAQPQNESTNTHEQVPSIQLGVVADAKPAEIELINAAIKDLNKVLASPEFKAAVLNMDAYSMNGYSDQEVYDLLVRSSPMKLSITIFDGDDDQNNRYHTQGYEDSNHPNTCFVNRYFLKANEGFLASLMLHEAMHVLGFIHHWYWHKYETVPYAMNDIYDLVAKQIGVPTSEGQTVESK